jgi:hypothetical protein
VVVVVVVVKTEDKKMIDQNNAGFMSLRVLVSNAHKNILEITGKIEARTYF